MAYIIVAGVAGEHFPLLDEEPLGSPMRSMYRTRLLSCPRGAALARRHRKDSELCNSVLSTTRTSTTIWALSKRYRIFDCATTGKLPGPVARVATDLD